MQGISFQMYSLHSRLFTFLWQVIVLNDPLCIWEMHYRYFWLVDVQCAPSIYFLNHCCFLERTNIGCLWSSSLECLFLAMHLWAFNHIKSLKHRTVGQWAHSYNGTWHCRVLWYIRTTCFLFVSFWAGITVLLLLLVEQAEELRKALEKERDLKHAEAIKEFNKVKLQVESKLRDLELRERKVEAIVSKVASFFFLLLAIL